MTETNSTNGVMKKSGVEIMARAEALALRTRTSDEIRETNTEIFEALADGRLKQTREVEGALFKINFGVMYNAAKKYHAMMLEGFKAGVLFDPVDLVQDVGLNFNKVVSGYDITSGNKLSTYLISCVRHAAHTRMIYCTAGIRSLEKDGLSLDVPGEHREALTRLVAASDLGDAVIEDAIQSAAFLGKKLSALHRFVGLKLNGMKLEEIGADNGGISKQAVEQRLKRLRPQIEQILFGSAEINGRPTRSNASMAR